MSGWVIVWTDEWIGEGVSYWMGGWVRMWMNKWVNEWVDGWLTLWVSQRVNDWVSDPTLNAAPTVYFSKRYRNPNVNLSGSVPKDFFNMNFRWDVLLAFMFSGSKWEWEPVCSVFPPCSLWHGTSELKDRGWSRCSGGGVAVAGQPAAELGTFLWRIPDKQRVDPDRCSLFPWVRSWHTEQAAPERRSNTATLTALIIVVMHLNNINILRLWIE